MTIRSLSLRGHKRPCDNSTSCSPPEALDDCHRTQTHTVTTFCLDKEGKPPAALTSCTHTGRLGRQNLNAGLLNDLRDKTKGKKKSQDHLLTQIVYFSVCQQVCMLGVMYVSYRVNNSPQGLEASRYRKHMFHSVCNSGKLEEHTDTERTIILSNLLFHVFAKCTILLWMLPASC